MPAENVDRRTFLRWGAGGTLGFGLLGAPELSAAQSEAAGERQAEGDWENFPQQPASLVRETVGASHGRFDRVRELVGTWPELAKCSWDHGFGDWESPIEAAAHTGNRDIALYLLDHGARPNIFTFAMLGELAVVKAMITALPELRNAAGPHGLSLLHHANVGEEAAASVRGYFEELGLVDAPRNDIPADLQQSVLGTYKNSEALAFEVVVGRQGLAVKPVGGTVRNLVPLPDGSFHPAGAPSVRFTFDASAGRATSASVRLAGRMVRFDRAA